MRHCKLRGHLLTATRTFYQGGIVGSQLGAVVTSALGVSATNLENFWLLVLICNASSVLPLALIGWVPATDPQLTQKPDYT